MGVGRAMVNWTISSSSPESRSPMAETSSVPSIGVGWLSMLFELEIEVETEIASGSISSSIRTGSSSSSSNISSSSIRKSAMELWLYIVLFGYEK